MARGTFSTSNHFNGSPLNALPFTVSLWFLKTDDGQTLWHLSEDPSGDHHVIQCSSAGFLTASSVDDSPFATGQALHATALSNSVWYNACAVFSASNSRSVFLNGTGKVTNTTNVNVNNANLTNTRLGAFRTVNAATDTLIACYGLWNVALTDVECEALGKGFAPHLVRPASLVQYMPLVRGSQSLKGDMAEVGTVPVGISHPPLLGLIAA